MLPSHLAGDISELSRFIYGSPPRSPTMYWDVSTSRLKTAIVDHERVTGMILLLCIGRARSKAPCFAFWLKGWTVSRFPGSASSKAHHFSPRITFECWMSIRPGVSSVKLPGIIT